jgi:superfamily II RNA helicase
VNTFPLQALLPEGAAYDPNADSGLLDRFLTYVQGRKVDLYPAQEEAILALYDGANVILNTPTGSGKSLVATALHFNSLAKGRRSFYTCPIKALVNEKFLALCHDFGPEAVGMVTGDASVNPKAPIICCTAEILANIALREGAKAPVDDVIMDEFHYYSDRERGVAWQVPLLTLPRARFLLMSATLGDVTLFEKGLTQLTGRTTTVVKSRERPVPLTFTYSENPLHETVMDLVREGKSPVYLVSFTQREAAEEAQNLLSVDFCSKDEKKQIAEALAGVRFTSPYGKDVQKLLRHGVGLHHAGLLPKYRVIVERLAQKGLLKVICGTDTLGVGVNIPIRTVLFSKLCKFDGEKTTLLSVRDFQQIAGRAGRKGFDERGNVVAQAPEHHIENLRQEQKAAGDPKRLKKLVKKKPPEKGFINWTKDSFEKLVSSEPEPLQSRFSVTHGMLLNVLSREVDGEGQGGCDAMRRLIRDSHEHAGAKQRHFKLAWQMFRSLTDRKIIELVDVPGRRKKGLRINVDLQEDFSLHQTLSLYLLDTVKLVDPYSPNYALDILTLAESIAENPELILRKQLDRIKGEKVMELKMAGVEYEERMAELEKLEYPKPNRDFIYDTFNAFAAKHPWIGQENIRPKSVVREMYEGFLSFTEYVRDYDLQRSEGLLLRYLSEIYKILVQTVPATAKDEEMEAIVDYLGGMIRGIDSSLLDEWEKLRRPDWQPTPTEEEQPGSADVTLNVREFTASIRNESFHFIKALGGGKHDVVAEVLLENDASSTWTPELLKERMEAYKADHQGPLTDRAARHPQHLVVKSRREEPGSWDAHQTLIDEDGHNDWVLEFKVDLAASREKGKPILALSRIGPIGGSSLGEA